MRSIIVYQAKTRSCLSIFSLAKPTLSQRSRWMGFIDDIVVRVAPTNLGSRIDLHSSSRYGRSDFGVNTERIRDYLTELRQPLIS